MFSTEFDGAKELQRLSQSSRDWTQLPDNLLDDISRRLPLLSALTMGRVCKPWRRVLAEQLPLPRRQGLPWLVLAAHTQYKERPCFSILQKSFWSLEIPDGMGKYCWGSVHDWLIVVNKRIRIIEIYLWNPFSRTKLDLPNASDRYTKMILSASPDDPNCLFLLVGIGDQSIACWTPGVKKWCVKDDRGRSCPFEDAVYCDGLFYFVTPGCDIQTLDAQMVVSAMKQNKDCTHRVELHLSPHSVTVPVCPIRCTHPLRLYLVESCGQVIMVCGLFICGAHRETRHFEVFKLDAREMVWRNMQGLGDRVLFIGQSDSRSFSAKDLGDGFANRIFFVNDFFCLGVNEWTRTTRDTTTPPIRYSTFKDWGSFDMDTKCFSPNGSNCGSRQTHPPIWITAPIWWFFTEKHQVDNVAKRTGQQEKNAHWPEKRKRMLAIDHHHP